MENAEFVGAICLTTSTAIDCSCNYVCGGLVSAISIGFLLVYLVTNWVYLEEECLPTFEVLNCWLNLLASCLAVKNDIPLKVIDSFSAVRFSLSSIPFIVFLLLHWKIYYKEQINDII